MCWWLTAGKEQLLQVLWHWKGIRSHSSLLWGWEWGVGYSWSDPAMLVRNQNFGWALSSMHQELRYRDGWTRCVAVFQLNGAQVILCPYLLACVFMCFWASSSAFYRQQLCYIAGGLHVACKAGYLWSWMHFLWVYLHSTLFLQLYKAVFIKHW